jgi:superfamily II DNA or RNA helicase
VIKIIGKLLDDNNISNTLVYCPKGIEASNEEDDKIIGLIADSVASNFDNINAHFFLGKTENRDLLLEDFENQDVDILYAIKCLDEGVNVPSTQNAIFIASGKNKREFIQRRGRILRKFEGKKHANVYDIIVLPTNEQYYQDKNYSEKLIIGEFGRLIEFLEISINKIDSKRIIDEQLSQIELSYHKVKNLIKENEKTRDIEKYN